MSSSDRPTVLRQPVLRGARRLRITDDPAEARVRREVELAQEREERYAQGVRDGQAATHDALAAEVTETLSGLAAVVDAVKQHEEHFLVQAEEEVVRLSVLLVEKILSTKVAGDLSGVQSLVKKTLATITDAREVAVRVNPEWIEAMERTSAELATSISVPGGIRWIPDRRVPKDGAIVETERGQLDASVHTQLDEAATVFREILHDRAR